MTKHAQASQGSFDARAKKNVSRPIINKHMEQKKKKADDVSVRPAMTAMAAAVGRLCPCHSADRHRCRARPPRSPPLTLTAWRLRAAVAGCDRHAPPSPPPPPPPPRPLG
ncbi:hypothetical protein I4F81_011283 [Pyropia yezoensis]|uniref:Uncharacterized protein n=1 Tax=Pyropia yezoensis TaxID=2788 RepID=A0ACC3CF16_PYRYE|nr:hypothetical protein I4F81_011283 [Neopyropia yezoensis]